MCTRLEVRDDEDLGKHRRRQGRRRRVSASSNGNNNRPNSSRLIIVRCRSTRPRLFPPDHHRLPLSLPLGSSGEGVHLHQWEGQPLVPDFLPIHRGRPHRRWRPGLSRVDDRCRDQAWMNRNGRGLVSESWGRRRNTDHFYYFFNYYLFSQTCCISFFLFASSSLPWQLISPGRVQYFRPIIHRINTSWEKHPDRMKYPRDEK